jgi:hypothetical protein
LIVPFPVPPLFEVISNQDWSAVAVQVHPAWAVTLTAPVPPDELKDWLEGEIEKVHEGGEL